MKNKNSFILLICILILNNTVINAQEKCDYDINKADPITEKQYRVINVPIKLFGIMQTISAWAIQLERLGEDYSIKSRISLLTNTEEYLEKGDSLMLKLESGKILTVYARNRVAPKRLNKPNQSPITYFESISPISKEDFKLLSSNKALFARSNVGPLIFEHQIKEKAGIKMQKAANCILQ